MKEIQLTQGKIAIVDDDDFENYGHFSWYAYNGHRNFYARRNLRLDENTRTSIVLHREIMKPGPGFWVDHINHNTLDNRRSNLRICTPQQSAMNHDPLKFKTTSGFPGVTWDKDRKKWSAQICINRNKKHIGQYLDKNEAHKAYIVASKKYFGAFSPYA